MVCSKDAPGVNGVCARKVTRTGFSRLAFSGTPVMGFARNVERVKPVLGAQSRTLVTRRSSTWLPTAFALNSSGTRHKRYLSRHPTAVSDHRAGSRGLVYPVDPPIQTARLDCDREVDVEFPGCPKLRCQAACVAVGTNTVRVSSWFPQQASLICPIRFVLPHG